MKLLLIVTAAIEAATGLALVVVPSVPVWLLFDTGLDTSAASTVGRIGGAALVSLGAVCWLARNDVQSHASRGLVAAMLHYNTAAVAILTYAGTALGLFGIGLWPAVVLHAGMATWCIACLRPRSG